MIAGWYLAVVASPGTLIPGPWSVALGIAELARNGLLVRYVVASLFRISSHTPPTGAPIR